MDGALHDPIQEGEVAPIPNRLVPGSPCLGRHFPGGLGGTDRRARKTTKLRSWFRAGEVSEKLWFCASASRARPRARDAHLSDPKRVVRSAYLSSNLESLRCASMPSFDLVALFSQSLGEAGLGFFRSFASEVDLARDQSGEQTKSSSEDDF